MDIPLNVEVSCADGPGGRSTTIILNPITSEITHVVVKHGRDEFMVPLNLITESTPNHIQLRCIQEELRNLEYFIKVRFLGAERTSPDYEMGAAFPEASWWPYTKIDDQYVDAYDRVEQIPHHELAIHKGAKVRALDGQIGQVDAFIVNPTNNQISHLVLLERHLFGRREVTISISDIDRIEQDTVFLKLDKKSVRALPDVPLSKRYWR